MIHQAEAAARALEAYLERHPQYGSPHAGRQLFLSTGVPNHALPLIEKFCGEKLPFLPW